VRAIELRAPPPAVAAAAPTPVPHPDGAGAGAFAELTPYWETRVAGFRAADFEARQVFVSCAAGRRADGSAAPADAPPVLVPMFLVHRRGLVGAGRPPAARALVYGYGGFNISLPPNFSPLRLAWLNDCDGLYALANIRGGGELGEEWHKAGSGLAKQNCFDDLAACGDYLVREGLAAKRRVAVIGGSNGGLLALACALRRPDLFGASVAQVPVADMMRFHKFTIGSAWRGEYGFAEESEADCANMLAYSPLHNVRAPASAAEQLPSVLITTADHDDRVVPLHSLKMAATLQAVAGASEHQTRPLLVRVDSKAGHGAGKSTTKVLDEYADVYAFIAHELEREAN
jgi:prolyl oligopeptidase